MLDNKPIEPEVITEVEEVNKINKKAIATIHNNLIQARHKLSLEEIRLMDTIISFIQPEDEDFKVYKIPVSIFKDVYGEQRKDIYDVAKRTVEGLLSKPIKIESVNSKGKRVFEMFNFISYGKYEEGQGVFYVSISPQFKPYLLKLKEFFTKIPIKYTYILRSRYAIRLYELLKQYEETGFRVDKIEDLREMLGVEENEYPRFVDFERWVLKKGIKEINEKTDLKVSYTKKKTGRKITHIEFEINSKNAKQGDTTQTTKTIPQNIDTQGQKQAVKNKIDLWKTTIEILANKYDLDETAYEVLRAYTYAKYKTDTTPKKLVICTDIATPRGKKTILEILQQYLSAIKKIVRIETMGNYTVAIHKTFLED
jgi:plasmid replication initiation protein